MDEQRLRDALDRLAQEADGSDKGSERVVRKGRERVARSVLIGASSIILLVGGAIFFGRDNATLPRPAEPAPAVSLPAPPDSLRDRLPDQLDGWVRPGLVLLYESGGVFDLFFEGVEGRTCPVLASRQRPDACISTGTRVTWGNPTEGLRLTGSHDLRIIPPPDGAEVLWRGAPTEGSIGAESPDACDRIERFERFYVCRDDRLVYVGEQETGFPSPSFDVPSDWFTDSGGTLPLGTTDQPGAWASTYDFTQQGYRGLYPRLEELPTDGIAIEASIIGAEDFPHEPNANFPPRDLPLNLDEADMQEEWEGQPARIPRYRILANVDGELVEVDVYFGRSDPTSEMLRSAARVLRTLKLPRASTGDDGLSVRGIDGRIAFLSERGRGCCFRLFVTEGSGPARKVNNVFGYGSRLDWSPDGRSIVMDRGLSEGHGALILVDIESGVETVLFSDEDAREAIDPQGPSWAPDGERIAFSSGAGDIYVMDVDGGAPRLLVSSPRTCGYGYPSWSPDGSEIAFSNGCPGGGISIVPADGGEQRRVTDGRRDIEPAWSPDGSKIAFTRFGPDGNQIVVLDLDSETETILTEETDSYTPSWSPDGSQIVFGSNRTGDQNIWLMNADGSDEFPVTIGRETSIAPAWAPR